MKNKAFIFAASGSLLIIAFLFITNYTTSWGHPWFLYPSMAVLWWPLSAFFAGKGKPKLFSIAGYLLISIFAIVTNLITSPGYLWFIYPMFAALWWPMSVIIVGTKRYRLYSIVASSLTILFFYLVNLISSPNTIWFIYPTFAVLWWPISMIIVGAKRYRLYSIVASSLTILFFYLVNLISSPNTIWFIYPTFAVLWCPISMIVCGAKKYKLYSIISSVYIIAFLALVNYLTSSSYAWFYYPAFLVLWWPLSMFFANKKTIKLYSIIMSLFMVGFLAFVNYLHTPECLWFYQTIFYFIWWPVVMLLGKKAKTLTFSIVSALAIIGYYVMQYLLLTPGVHPWYLYIILPVIWWPVCMTFRDKLHTKTFAFISLSVFTIYYSILNLILSPNYLWVIYIIYAFSWIVMGNYFGKRKKYFALSICASIVTIVFFSLVNYMNSPNHIWAIYPAFAIVWWPLSLYFFRVRKKVDTTADIEQLGTKS